MLRSTIRSCRPVIAVSTILLLGLLGPQLFRARAADTSVPGAVSELLVTASDFAFAAPRTTPAGLTRIVLRNEGTQFHHVQLVRLAPGRTYAEYLDRLQVGDFEVAWATFVGGPDTPGPGGEAEATLLLAEGNYVMLCLISGIDKVPHTAKGMSFPITVGPPDASRADNHIILDEYSFSISPEIRVGRRTIRVENRGQQVHHVAIVKLGVGRTAEDALRWAASLEGVPPDAYIGGTTGIAPGLTNDIAAEFTAGEYALICFIPDEADGQSHARHGMLQQIRVR